MARNGFFTGLDIGTSSIKVLVECNWSQQCKKCWRQRWNYC